MSILQDTKLHCHALITIDVQEVLQLMSSDLYYKGTDLFHRYLCVMAYIEQVLFIESHSYTFHNALVIV